MLNGPFVQELLDAILLPATLATIKIPGHSKLDSLEAKENHFADISIRNAALKGTKRNQNLCHDPEGYFPNIVRLGN